MSSDDIANLYRQFGGSADNYKELGRDNVVRQSRERWPLLATVRAQDAARPVRPVVPGEILQSPAPAASRPPPMPMVFDEFAAGQAAADARARAFEVEPVEAVAPPTALPVQQAPIEPVFTAPVEPVPEWMPPAPPVAAPVPAAPVATLAPVAPVAPQAVAAPAGTELQGLFARLARPVEPVAPVDRSGSLLKRLLKP